MIVIKDGKHFSKIYASIAFDPWGNPTQEDVRVVENWDDIDIPKDAKKIDADKYMYTNFDEYFKMIENTLWIFNNEKLKIKEDVYMTGAGVNWMFQKGKVNVYDISKVQVKFIKSLLADWDGKNYGQKVYDFIKDNTLMHFHVNLNEKVDPNKTLFIHKEKFIQAINDNLEMLKQKYAPDWIWNPKDINVCNENLIDVLPNVYLGKTNLSNIFNFKYYFAKLYTHDVYKLLAPSTKAFIQKHSGQNKHNANNPPCKKLNTKEPVKDFYNEIQYIKKYLFINRSDSGKEWGDF